MSAARAAGRCRSPMFPRIWAFTMPRATTRCHRRPPISSAARSTIRTRSTWCVNSCPADVCWRSGQAGARSACWRSGQGSKSRPSKWISATAIFCAPSSACAPSAATPPSAALRLASQPDVIALWHALEHLHDPWRLLEAACAKLANGGALMVAMPNPHSLQLRLFGRFWTHIDTPRHLHLVPSGVLCDRLARLGPEAELVTTTDAGSIGWDDFG